jgi:dihydrofolate reductase
MEPMNIVMIAALTADGFIGRSSDHLSDWTSTEDKKLFVQVTKAAGIVVMGRKTFATIGKALPGRRMIVYTSHVESVTASNVETTSETPQALVARLQTEGATGLVVCGGTQIYSMFMQAGLVNELYLTLSPRLFGTGLRLFNDPVDTRLRLLETSRLGDEEVLLHYEVTSNASVR